GPSSTVVSGDPRALDEFLAGCETQEIRVRRIAVDYASHSAQVDDVTDELTAALAGITPRVPEIPFFSTVAGEPVDAAVLDAGYWARNLRDPVLFEGTVRALLAAGRTTFIEVSPHPVLTVGVQETIDAAADLSVTADSGAVVFGTLRRDDGGPGRFLTSLAEAFTRGIPIDWAPLFTGAAQRVDLPTYAFQRRRYWIGSDGPAAATVAASAPGAAATNPAEARFWAAVEDEDLDALSRALGERATPRREELGTVLPMLSGWRRGQQEESLLDRSRYQITWSPLPVAESAAPTGTWILAVPTGNSEASRIADVLHGLRTGGPTVVIVELAAADRAEVARRLAEAAADQTVTTVVSLAALATEPDPDHPAIPRGLALTVTVAQALGDAAILAPLWCVTSGAVSTGADGAVVAPEQAAVWGLGRVVAVEHPDRWGGLVDLPREPDDRAVSRLRTVIAGVERGEGAAVRAAGVFAQRLVRARVHADAPVHRWNPPAVALVVGEPAGRGGQVARWLAGSGARHLALAVPSDAAGLTELRADLTGLGARSTLLREEQEHDGTGDGATPRAALPEGLEAVVVGWGEAGGAGTAVAELDLGAFAAAVGDRIAAAGLDAAVFGDGAVSGGDPPEAAAELIVVSSLAGLWGSGGQSVSAAAEGYLDALARRRRSLGGAAVSVALGDWAGGQGMVDRPRLAGLGVLSAKLAAAALERAVGAGAHSGLVVADIDWEQLLVTFPAAARLPLLRDLAEVRAHPATDGAPAVGEPSDGAERWRRRVGDLVGADQERAVLDLVRAEAAVVLGQDGAGAVRPGRPFRDLGFDSLTVVDLRNRMREATGVPLPTTVIFDYPTPAELARYLLDELLRGPAGPAGQSAGSPLAGPGDLDGLAAGLPLLSDDVRAAVLARMRTLLRRWDDSPDGEAGGDAATDDLDAASDDEIFDLIDNELGIS
ncbi:acyltransferase domain-containing protein, partial [Frankia sp. AgPm24]|uniref:acyltransferase domain-containing protein n=1 Tax=Frankia sp. AgPm24 TaxID=631128 RepID=UPI00200EB113